MKKMFAAMTAAVMIVALVSSTAFASTAKPLQFTATYTVSLNGSPTSTWTCSGVHINNKTFKDSETCVISGDTTGFVAGTYTSGTGGWGNLPPFGSVQWTSDFNSAIATSWTITIVDNGNGVFTADIVAYYSS
jgi:hypothetical protein